MAESRQGLSEPDQVGVIKPLPDTADIDARSAAGVFASLQLCKLNDTFLPGRSCFTRTEWYAPAVILNGVLLRHREGVVNRVTQSIQPQRQRFGRYKSARYRNRASASCCRHCRS
jgi:hypothetical protein